MRSEGVPAAHTQIFYFADVCYVGQSYHLEIPLQTDAANPLETLYRDFLAAHDRIYGHSTEGAARIVNLRSIHRSTVGRPATAAPARSQGDNAHKGKRSILTAESDRFIPADVYDRSTMRDRPRDSRSGHCRATRHDDPDRARLARDCRRRRHPYHHRRLREQAMTSQAKTEALDPITVEVVRYKLDGIANEMQSTLLRSSFSPIVKEGLDASASLFTADGTTLSQSCSIPIHLATLIPAVAKVLETYPIDGMRDGDIYILNDPYTGGTHLPDIAVIAPVFHRGKVIALSGAMTHHQDVGGMSAGSVPTNATEIYQEGLRIPPLKLRDGGVFNDTLVKMIRQNVRIPDTVMGDLNAQVAACTVAARRLAELADGYGHNQLASIFDELLQRSEIMTRKALSAIPEGTYRFVDYLDNDGIELDKPIRIEVAVTVKGGDIEFDFEGTSPQTKGPLNCVPSGSLAAACFAVRALTDPTIPTNGGCFRPIKLRLPEGTIVNPQEPAAVNARTSTIKRITGCMIGALAQILPERVPAGVRRANSWSSPSAAAIRAAAATSSAS